MYDKKVKVFQITLRNILTSEPLIRPLVHHVSSKLARRHHVVTALG
jgi:hypothetical protein